MVCSMSCSKDGVWIGGLISAGLWALVVVEDDIIMGSLPLLKLFLIFCCVVNRKK